MCNYFYLLKGTLYRSPNNPEDLIEIHEVFENDNLIEARERAFEVYQNYVDVQNLDCTTASQRWRQYL